MKENGSMPLAIDLPELHDSLSRRDALRLGTLGSLALALGCRTTAPPSTDERARKQLEDLMDSVASLKTQEANLPGIQSADAIAASAFAGLSADDATLLGGRLYLDALERLKGRLADSQSSVQAAPDLSRERVRDVLREPLPAARFGREYFAGLLAETKARAERDGTYNRRVRNAAAEAARNRVECECNIGPCWLCVIVIVIIIVIIVL